MVRFGQVSQHLVHGDEGHDDRTRESRCRRRSHSAWNDEAGRSARSIPRGRVDPLNKHYTVGFDASAKIKRTKFGVSTLVPLISDDVDIIISAAFERQS